MTGTLDSERERLLSQLYETVLDPDRYDALMEAWGVYLDRSIDPTLVGNPDLPPAIGADPALGEHFRRVHEMLEMLGRNPQRSAEDETQNRAWASVIGCGHVEPLCPSAEQLLGVAPRLAQLSDVMEAESAARFKKLFALLPSADTERFATILTLWDAQQRPFHAAVFLKRLPSGEFCLLLEAVSFQWPDGLSDALTGSFGLSKAEISVIRSLASGLTLNEIAETKSRSLHTIRAHSKSALKKTQTSSQTELVRMVLVLGQIASAQNRLSRPAALGPSTFVTAQPGRVELPDGRAMDVHYHGPPHGRAAIFIHGMLDGTSIVSGAERALSDAGLRLICPIRPGFGGSEKLSPEQDARATFTEDLAFLIKTLEIEKPVLIGHMSGSIFAYGAAQKIGASIAGLVSVSGGVPILSPRQFAAMAPRQKVVAYTARYAQPLLPTILRAGISQIDRGETAKFMDALYPVGLHDRAVIDAQGIAALVQDGYRFAVQQGYDGFASDARYVTQDWSDIAAACPVRAIHIHGAHDPVVVLDSVRAFTEHYAFAELRAHEDAGQLIFYQKPEVVVDAVLDLLGPVERLDKAELTVPA